MLCVGLLTALECKWCCEDCEGFKKSRVELLAAAHAFDGWKLGIVVGGTKMAVSGTFTQMGMGLLRQLGGDKPLISTLGGSPRALETMMLLTIDAWLGAGTKGAVSFESVCF